MYSQFARAFAAPPHVYELANGQTLRLMDMERRELERLQLKVSEMTTKVLGAAVAADPRAPVPTDFASHVTEALIMEFSFWFLSVQRDQIAADHEMNQVPQVLPDLLELVRSMSPSEGRLVREAVCQSPQLWRMLCALSPSLDLNPDHVPRTPHYEAMRLRFLSWVNTINREIPTPSVRDDTGADSPPPKPPRSPQPTPRQRELLQEAAREIRTLHTWQGLGGEIAPHAIVTLPGWPAGRPLQIRNMDGTLLDQFGPAQAPGKTPVTMLLDHREGHYAAQINGRKVPTPTGGDCFYRATLVALGTEDRTALLKAVDADDEDAFGDATLSRLREATSRQLEAEPMRFGPMLELLQLAETSPGR